MDSTGLSEMSTSLLPLPCLTPCAAIVSDSSGCGMRVRFQGPRHVLLGLEITRLRRRLCFSSLTLWAVHPHPHLLWFCQSWTIPFHQLTTYDSVCPISAHREKPPQALLIRCFLVSRDSASVPDLAYLTTLYTCSQRSHDRNLGHHLPWDPSAPLTLHTGIPCRK